MPLGRETRRIKINSDGGVCARNIVRSVVLRTHALSSIIVSMLQYCLHGRPKL
jgi:hypothetical protein